MHCVCFEQVLLSLVVEPQMVIFGSKVKETGVKIVAIVATAPSQHTSSCVFLKVQYWCPVSVILTHSFQRYSLFCNLFPCHNHSVMTSSISNLHNT